MLYYNAKSLPKINALAGDAGVFFDDIEMSIAIFPFESFLDFDMRKIDNSI